jgi:hypothetical protein
MHPSSMPRGAALRSFVLEVLLVVLLALSATGCDLIGGVVKFSFWVVLIVVLLAALLISALIKLMFG